MKYPLPVRSQYLRVLSIILPPGAALLADWIGEPPAKYHPVVWYGKLISQLKKPAPHRPVTQLFYGTAMLVLAAPFALVPALLVQKLLRRMPSVKRSFFVVLLSSLLEGVSLKPFFALHMLVQAGRTVRLALENDDLPAARDALQSLVSRDRSQLSVELAAAAAVESLAENLSDSVVAPLFYYTLFGLPGAALYRLYNTFDSMIGYHGQYEYLGKAAARFDDLLNLLPSRLTALLILLLAPLFGGDQARAWRIWRRDARKTASPNAGHPMSAAAGALDIQLEKVGHYVLGDAHQKVTPRHIRQAERMVWLVGGSAFLLAALCRLLLRSRDE